jgi:hypothetical protein
MYKKTAEETSVSGRTAQMFASWPRQTNDKKIHVSKQRTEFQKTEMQKLNSFNLSHFSCLASSADLAFFFFF